MAALMGLLSVETCRAAAPPSGASVAESSNVVWTDATWKSDGTGAMPIGNGDVTSGVWVDGITGDLRMYISKSDVFDENSQPVKTGVLRLTFDPPLFKSGQTSGFEQTLVLSNSTVIVKTKDLEVKVWVELNAPLRNGVAHRDAGIMHVTAAAVPGAPQLLGGFGLKVSLEPYRKEEKTTLGRGFCTLPAFPLVSTHLNIFPQLRWLCAGFA